MSTLRQLSSRILNAVHKQHAPQDFLPTVHINPTTNKKHWHPPKFSLRQQALMRKSCLVQDIDPTSIGMPSVKEKGILRKKPYKLQKHQRTAAERQANIAKKLDNMPKTIQAWKENKLSEKAKKQSDMPF
ncbi:hypothetical protein BZG36_00920 [Bifiguratus adelaidae]|uniref:Large ribosomal subunit protein mL59 domain-containing protein n=1 Tax=Bifiguratus adelaidae TaxID=1938954 RepID=A0A261Y5S6_9FUNG|nr:hypothetical protein BZG36_00920 [Bifiguratus adelaidae]